MTSIIYPQPQPHFTYDKTQAESHVDYGQTTIPKSKIEGQPLTNFNFTTLQIIGTITALLEQIIVETDCKTDSSQQHTHFDAKAKPKISILNYLQRVATFSQCSQECYILALIYLDRITEKHQQFVLNSLNIHRLLLISVMLAAKFVDDKYYNNKVYSKIGGITNQEVNLLEKEFLSLLNYELYVSTSHYEEYQDKIFSVNLKPNKDKEIIKEEPKPQQAEIAEQS